MNKFDQYGVCILVWGTSNYHVFSDFSLHPMGSKGLKIGEKGIEYMGA